MTEISRAVWSADWQTIHRFQFTDCTGQWTWKLWIVFRPV